MNGLPVRKQQRMNEYEFKKSCVTLIASQRSGLGMTRVPKNAWRAWSAC